MCAHMQHTHIHTRWYGHQGHACLADEDMDMGSQATDRKPLSTVFKLAVGPASLVLGAGLCGDVGEPWPCSGMGGSGLSLGRVRPAWVPKQQGCHQNHQGAC